jgi:hypothetical protein
VTKHNFISHLVTTKLPLWDRPNPRRSKVKTNTNSTNDPESLCEILSALRCEVVAEDDGEDDLRTYQLIVYGKTAAQEYLHHQNSHMRR